MRYDVERWPISGASRMGSPWQEFGREAATKTPAGDGTNCKGVGNRREADQSVARSPPGQAPITLHCWSRLLIFWDPSVSLFAQFVD